MIALRQLALTALECASLHWRLQMSPAKGGYRNLFTSTGELKKLLSAAMPHGDETIIRLPLPCVNHYQRENRVSIPLQTVVPPEISSG
jgi:hypothetical protein